MENPSSCFDADPQVRAMAHRYLWSRYVREANDDGLRRLAAVAVLQGPSIENRRELTAVLASDGQWDLAMLAALSLPESEREPSWLLPVARQLGWWQLCDATLALLPDGEVRCYWNGVRHLDHGDYGRAESQLALGGPSGQALARHIRWGRSINQQLRQPADAARLAGVLDWERWQASHPGPWVWQLDEA